MKAVSANTFKQEFEQGLDFIFGEQPKDMLDSGSNTRNITVNTKVDKKPVPRKANFRVAVLLDNEFDWGELLFKLADEVSFISKIVNDIKILTIKDVNNILERTAKYFDVSITDLQFKYIEGLYLITEPNGYQVIISDNNTFSFK